MRALPKGSINRNLPHIFFSLTCSATYIYVDYPCIQSSFTNFHRDIKICAYLVQVDDRLPEVVALLVEIPHSDLSKVTRMVLVHVRSVVVLSTSETSTTGMLAVLSYTTVTGGDVTAAVEQNMLASILLHTFAGANPIVLPIASPIYQQSRA